MEAQEPITTQCVIIQTNAAAQPALCLTWDSLAACVAERWAAAVQDHNRSFCGGLAVGALIVMFSERPEVQAEIAQHCTGKRGPKFTATGWVAARLSREYGNKVPGAKHMNACARAAVAARKRGLTQASFRELLGWDGCQAPPLQDSLSAPSLPEPDTDGAAAGKLGRADYAKLVLARFHAIEHAAQELAAKKPRGFRWAYPLGKEAFDARLEECNRWLKHLGLEIVEK